MVGWERKEVLAQAEWSQGQCFVLEAPPGGGEGVCRQSQTNSGQTERLEGFPCRSRPLQIMVSKAAQVPRACGGDSQEGTEERWQL